GEGAQGGRLQDGEVAVASAHAHHRGDVHDVAVVGRLRAVVDGPDLHAVEGAHEGAPVVEVAGALAEHGHGLVHPHHHAGGLAAGEPLHLHFDRTHVDGGQVGVEVAQVGSAPAEAIALGGQLGQRARDVDEVLVGVPAPPHALDVE